MLYYHPYQLPLQAQGDMGFLWADTRDDMAKNIILYYEKLQYGIYFEKVDLPLYFIK